MSQESPLAPCSGHLACTDVSVSFVAGPGGSRVDDVPVVPGPAYRVCTALASPRDTEDDSTIKSNRLHRLLDLFLSHKQGRGKQDLRCELEMPLAGSACSPEPHAFQRRMQEQPGCVTLQSSRGTVIYAVSESSLGYGQALVRTEPLVGEYYEVLRLL